jgi:universal stress protein E
MIHFKNILVVLGDNINPIQNPALSHGAALAKKHSAQLMLMDVITVPEHAINQYQGIIKPKEFINMLAKKREKELYEAAATLHRDINVSVKIATGRDFIEIIRQMVFGDHDLLIKVANDHKESFGSSDFNIIRKCPKPVWLLKSKDSIECRKILATVDLASEDTQEGRALNLSIMNLATSFAKWENSQLDVLSCWSLYGENSLRHSGFLRVSDETFERLIKEEEKNNRSRLDVLIARYENQEINAHLIKGDPIHHIPKFTKENAIDTVIMGTVGRAGIPGLLIGNTSETILHSINSSVITLKPEGFKSPII